MPTSGRCRASDLGLRFGDLARGPLNAITDVAPVRVGHATVIADGPRPARTGVTAILPHPDGLNRDLFAGFHRFNGYGEMTGVHWIEEVGLLASPILLTGTYSVGLVRDVLIAMAAEQGRPDRWHEAVVAETLDGRLNDAPAQHVTRAHVAAAIAAATTSDIGAPVAEGGVGGGTGMVCHQFKGGIGTASRVAEAAGDRFVVGVLVQANYGARHQLTIAGMPVGRMIPLSEVPAPIPADGSAAGSIIIIVATDAPLIPPQLTRLAQRATIGLARVGGLGHNGSGDLFLAFSTAQTVPAGRGPHALVHGLSMVPNEAIDPLFAATADATEEAIVNALCAAETMTGRRGTTAHALPLERLREALAARPGPPGG